jgi:hypothetical protein
MFTFDIDFEWPVARQYEIGHGPTSTSKIVRAIYPTQGPVTLCRPLDDKPALYAEFLDLDASEPSILQFANKYGLLEHNIAKEPAWMGSGSIFPSIVPYSDPGWKWSEPISAWSDGIRRLKRLQEFLKEARSHPREVFRRRERFHLIAPLAVALEMKNPKDLPVIDLRPSGTLLDALELQCLQAFFAGRTSYQCAECSRWMEIGPGARRSHAKFCSRTCKDRARNREKAKRAKAAMLKRD